MHTGLYEKCKYAVDCYVFADFEASYCDGGICKCSPGFYQREYRTCRREGKSKNLIFIQCNIQCVPF